jgi:hypothetical protein
MTRGGKSTNTDGRSNGNPRLRRGSTHIPTVNQSATEPRTIVNTPHRVLKEEQRRKVRVKRASTILPHTGYKNEHDDQSPLKNIDTDLEAQPSRKSMSKTKSHVVIQEYDGEEDELELADQRKKRKNKK